MAGRCVPAFISDVIDEAAEAGDEIRDKYNKTVTEDDLEDGSK